MCMSKEQKYWADACAVVVTSEPLVNPFTKPSSCVTPCAPQNHDAECENTPHENILPLFAAVEALRGEDGTYPTNIEIKDGILNITLNDGTVLTTDGSTLVTGDYVDNAVEPYVCSFTERALWGVMNGTSFTLSQEDTKAICFSPKGVRVLFRDDYGLLSGIVLSCGHYYSDILILLVGPLIYYISTAMREDDRLEMISGNNIDIQALATKTEVANVADTKQDIISDLDAIRSGASKGATALQSVPSEYVTESELVAKEYATKSQVNAKQDKITDLDTIREGASKGATALQEHQPLKTINGQTIVGEGNINIEGSGGSADLSGYATEEYVDNAVAEVNVKGEDGYVYSNGEKVDMRFTRSLIPVGTRIPANANLNTVAYLKVGKYYCSQNADAKTITNCPSVDAFSMEVFNPLSPEVDNETTSTYVYRLRLLTVYNTGVQYIQYCTVGSTVNKWTYNAWNIIPRSPFTLNSSKKGGSAALGSATQGVYVSANGTLTKMTYTLGKSVPSSAVFTDTKVTAVGNHYTPAEDESAALDAPDGEVVVGLKRDAAGHVVDVISAPMSGDGGVTEDYVDNAIKAAITDALTTEV